MRHDKHEVIGHIRITGHPVVHIRRCTTVAALQRYLRRHDRARALPSIVGRIAAGVNLVIVQ
jgi:hypothetical protein